MASASLCLVFTSDLREGVLDPFPLLLGVEGEGAPANRRRPFNKVNPLLLVTERKGAASSLHYGAFPLDAFHTDGAVRIDLGSVEYSKTRPGCRSMHPTPVVWLG